MMDSQNPAPAGRSPSALARQNRADQKIITNRRAIKKPIRPQPGKVRTQVITMSLTTDHLTEERRLAAPTPMMAVVLVWVVLTGRAVREASSKQPAAAASAAKP